MDNMELSNVKKTVLLKKAKRFFYPSIFYSKAIQPTGKHLYSPAE